MSTRMDQLNIPAKKDQLTAFEERDQVIALARSHIFDKFAPHPDAKPSHYVDCSMPKQRLCLAKRWWHYVIKYYSLSLKAF